MSSSLFKQQMKRAIATRGQKACIIIDHLVEALANDPSANLKRALILNHISENPGITQTEIMKKVGITKSSMNREVEWLFNYGCIRRFEGEKDGRTIKLEACGYAKTAIESAVDYFPDRHKGLQNFIELYINILKRERPTLRDAKVISTLYDKGKSSKSDLVDNLYDGPATTDNRILNRLKEDGIIRDE